MSGVICDGYVIDVYKGDGIWIVMPLFEKYYKWNCVLRGVHVPETVVRGGRLVHGDSLFRSILTERVLHRSVKVVCGEFDAAGRVMVEVFVEDDSVNEYLNCALELPV